MWKELDIELQEAALTLVDGGQASEEAIEELKAVLANEEWTIDDLELEMYCEDSNGNSSNPESWAFGPPGGCDNYVELGSIYCEWHGAKNAGYRHYEDY